MKLKDVHARFDKCSEGKHGLEQRCGTPRCHNRLAISHIRRLVPPVTSAVPSTVPVVGVMPARASSRLCSSCACVEAPKARTVDLGKWTKGMHMERGIIYAAMSCTRTSLGDGCREGSCEDDAMMPPGFPSASSARALFVCHSFRRFLDSV